MRHQAVKALPSPAAGMLAGVSFVTLPLASWALTSLFLGQSHRTTIVSNDLILSTKSVQ